MSKSKSPRTDRSAAKLGPGRRRDPTRTRAILAAAYELLVEEGLEAITTAKLARAAGVSTATLYRWWPTKEAIVLDGYLANVEARVRRSRERSGEGADALELLRAGWRSSVEAFAGSEGPVLASLLARAQAMPDLRAELLERLVRPRREQDRALVERAIGAGSLRSDLDPDAFLDALFGPLYFRLLVGHADLSLSSLEGHFELILEGAAP